MGCTNCGQHKDILTLPTGCNKKGSCHTLSCDKLSVFDWLSNMNLPDAQTHFDIYEVRFKNGRKEYFRNSEKLPLCTGEAVAVETKQGHDIGSISLSGELVKNQLSKRKINPDSDDIKKIYRKATQRDIDIWEKAKSRELPTQQKARLIIDKLGLKMKLSDVEYQGDNKKATFYYTADTRVDFRQLIKELATAFMIRIEMKQVDLRHEASRLGGIGSCGRELCCASWLTDFKRVNTQAARYQQLSLSPSKLQGQCGRLKCCLNFELDSYLDALKEFPNTEKVLLTEKGKAKFIKMDIFKRLIWYAYEDSDDYKWYPLSVEKAHEIIALNKKGQKAGSLSDFEVEEELQKINFEDAVGVDSITRFDKPKTKKKKRRNRRNKNSFQNKNKKSNNRKPNVNSKK